MLYFPQNFFFKVSIQYLLYAHDCSDDKAQPLKACEFPAPPPPDYCNGHNTHFQFLHHR